MCHCIFSYQLVLLSLQTHSNVLEKSGGSASKGTEILDLQNYAENLPFID